MTQAILSRSYRWFTSSGGPWISGLGFIYFMVLALYRIDYAGLYYDELLFVRPALSLDFPNQLFEFLPRIFPYIGPFKALLYYPVFLLFEPSVLSVRLPILLISVSTLLIWWRVFRRLYSAVPAAFLLLYIASDMAFISHSRHDWGPTVFQNFFVALASYCLVVFLQSAKLRALPVLFFVCFMGYYDKVNFLWFILAASISTLLVFPDKLFNIFMKRPVGVSAIVLLGAILCLLVYLFDIALVADGGVVWTFHNFQHRLNVARDTYSGLSVLKWIYLAKGLPSSKIPELFMWLAPLSFVVWMVVFAAVKRVRAELLEIRLRLPMFASLIVVIMFFFTMLTGAAGGSHHAMAYWPYCSVAVASGLIVLFDIPRIVVGDGIIWGNILRGGLIVSLVSVISFNLSLGYSFFKFLSSEPPLHGLWSNDLRQVADYFDGYSEEIECIYTGDWGINLPLQVYLAPHLQDKLVEVWPLLNQPIEVVPDYWRHVAGSVFEKRKGLCFLVLHGKKIKLRHSQYVRDGFLRLAKGHLPTMRMRRRKRILDHRGDVHYVIYSLISRTDDGVRVP